MNTSNSNEKSISKLQDDSVKGDDILGGGKSAPVITVQYDDAPTNVIMPDAILADDIFMDHANGGLEDPAGGSMDMGINPEIS